MKQLIVKTAVALTLGAVVTAICYYFVDRPVALFVYDHWRVPADLLQWPVRISGRLQGPAMATVLLIVLWRIWRPGGRLQTTLAASSASLIVAMVLKAVLKWAFGRTWPGPWPYDGPSLIGDGAYGFHPFHLGPAFMAFPSGHAAMTFSVISVLWLAYPRWRWLWAIVAAGLSTALVALNFHFVGDVIAGALLGSITGVYAARLFRVAGDDLPRQPPGTE
jgi:membrane-associated phospholipid phosphatase